MTTDTDLSVLRDVLRVYDHRYLTLDADQRGRLLDGTRRVLGTGLSAETRAALPAADRLRAFCIQQDLPDELERLIRDEVEGRRPGAVVVGGRVYAMYPYLRGVPRQDADITAEVGVEHRLDDVAWQGRRGDLRITGTARLERVDTHRTAVDVVLRARTGGVEHRVPADTTGDGFSAVADLAVLDPGRWDVFVTTTALGLSRESRFGSRRSPGARTDGLTRGLPHAHATVYFTPGGHLAVRVRTDLPPSPLRARLRSRLRR
ncbi:hypothetical protein [Actinomadura flavalba]|uniref:hypothetical protein n=1 Tax=Actinomadura flavalba TaxID=1120938 RepID=UPI00036820B3|nr:hypothetical protein [Actinomadura flavalba]